MDAHPEALTSSLAWRWQFNTFTPGGTTVAKQCILTAKRVGDEVYLLVAATSKFKSSEPLLRDVAASFAALPTGQPAKVLLTLHSPEY